MIPNNAKPSRKPQSLLCYQSLNPIRKILTHSSYYLLSLIVSRQGAVNPSCNYAGGRTRAFRSAPRSTPVSLSFSSPFRIKLAASFSLGPRAWRIRIYIYIAMQRHGQLKYFAHIKERTRARVHKAAGAHENEKEREAEEGVGRREKDSGYAFRAALFSSTVVFCSRYIDREN